MLKSILRRIIDASGYQVLRKDHYNILMPLAEAGYDHEEVARENIERVRHRSMVAYVSLLSLWEQVRHCEVSGITGDFVECGVWKGGSVALMALANLRYGEQRRQLHLFDVFDNICEPDPVLDGERALAEVARYGARERSTSTGQLKPTDRS